MVGGIVDAPANVTLELHLTANTVAWSGTPILLDAEATLYDGDLQDDTETDVFIKN